MVPKAMTPSSVRVEVGGLTAGQRGDEVPVEDAADDADAGGIAGAEQDAVEHGDGERRDDEARCRGHRSSSARLERDLVELRLGADAEQACTAAVLVESGKR